MGNKQHSWSGQLAKHASSTSRSDYEWTAPKTFGCRSLSHWFLKTQQDPHCLDPNQTELWETSLSLTPESTRTEHWIRSRHFSVLELPVEGEGGKDGLELRGSEPWVHYYEDNSNPSRMNSDLLCGNGEVNTGQRTIFNRLIKSIYLNNLVNNILIQKSMYTPHCCPPSHISLLFFNSKWQISGQTTKHWVRSSLLMLCYWKTEVTLASKCNKSVFSCLIHLSSCLD